MKTKVREIQVRVKMPTGYGYFDAIIRDGEVTSFESIASSCPDTQKLEAYICFCKEIIEAIKETQ